MCIRDRAARVPKGHKAKAKDGNGPADIRSLIAVDRNEHFPSGSSVPKSVGDRPFRDRRTRFERDEYARVLRPQCAFPFSIPPPHTHNKATDSLTRRIVSLRDRFSEVDLAYLPGTPSPSLDAGLMNALMLHVHILSVDSREHPSPKHQQQDSRRWRQTCFLQDNLSVLNSGSSLW